MAVIGSNQDQGVVELADGLELRDGRADCVVELEKFTESTVIVQSVHLLVDGRSFGHHEPALVPTSGLEDINGFQGHLFQTRLVKSIAHFAVGAVALVLEVLWVHIAVQPFGHVEDGEDPKGLGAIRRLLKSRVVENDVVAFLGKLGVVVLALERCLARVELLGAAPEKNIRTGPVGPGIVGDAVKVRVHDGPILATITGVSCQRGRGRIGNECGGDDTDTASPDSAEDLRDVLNLWVVKGTFRGVGVDPEGIHGGLVARVKGSG